MIKLKDIIKESKWSDRNWGDPLPTLSDVARKHQTEAGRPGEPDPQKAPGKVWKGQDGNWVSWNKKDPSPAGKEYGIKSKKAAEKWAAGEKVGYDDGDHEDDEKEPAGKLGGGDFDRGSDDDSDDMYGGPKFKDDEIPSHYKDDSDSETGKDYVSKFQGTDEPEGGEADDYGVKAGSMADDEEAKQAVQGALQGQASDIEKLKDLGYEAMVDLIQSDEDFDTKVKSYVHAMGESTETSKIHILRETYERIGGK